MKLLEVEPTQGVTDLVIPDQGNFATLFFWERTFAGDRAKDAAGVHSGADREKIAERE